MGNFVLEAINIQIFNSISGELLYTIDEPIINEMIIGLNRDGKK